MDPTECELMVTADGFAKDYCELLEANHYLWILEQAQKGRDSILA